MDDAVAADGVEVEADVVVVLEVKLVRVVGVVVVPGLRLSR